MTPIKKAMMLRDESDARAKAEERLRKVIKDKAAIEHKVQVQVEKKLHTQQQRFGGLIEKIEAQVNEEMAKAKAHLEELLERVDSYKAAAEQKRANLNDAQEQLKAETAAKIKAYEQLRIERRHRIKAQARLSGDITEVKVRAIVKPSGINRYTKTGTLRPELINNYKLRHQTFIKPRPVRMKTAVLSALAILSAIAIALSVGNGPSAGDSGQEVIRKPAPVQASIVSNINSEPPNDVKTTGPSGGIMSGSAISTASTAALNTDSETKRK